MSVANEHLPQTATPFRFVDLLPEIRLEKLGGILEQPEVPRPDVRWEDFQAERDAIRTTRKALTLVCRQVSNEFVPILYRHSTIIIHTLKPPIPIPHNAIRHRTPSIFEKDFLNTVSFVKLSSIRHLSYDVSMCDHYPRYLARFDRTDFERASAIHTDADGLADFTSMLARIRDRLPSLEQVTISWDGDRTSLRNRLTREQARRPEAVWRVANEDGNLERLEGTLTKSTSEETPAALCGWSVTREVHVDGRGVWPVVNVHSLEHWYLIEKVTIDFQRLRAGTAENSLQEGAPKLLVHGDF
ncbi:hypothetical protein H2200_008507 [Cladophialophora chaetospira]|uniref:Uncharacterized protein n=1 Tax=Cladophialophora chaetospira TaxID=386627 RepID=A0AA39CG62_9EURO|nr:hypothetical protein H2200_008507 [Cladophialophora chaetospira]